MTAREQVLLAFQRAEEHARAGRWHEVKVALAPVREDLAEVPRALLLLADSYCRLHDPEPARLNAEHAVELSHAAGDAEGEMKAQNILGIVHFETGDLDAALGRFLSALDLAYRLEQHLMCARITNNLGTLCSLRGDHEAATEHYREALALYERLGDATGQAQTLHNLGITYRDQERFDEADDSFARAARAAQAVSDHRLFGLCVVARAELLLRKGDLQGAERMARIALLRFDVHSSLFGLAEVHKLLGTVARLRGDTDSARVNLDKALDLCDLHAGPLLEAETRLERAMLRTSIGEHEAAREDLEAAIARFDQLGAESHAARARALLDPAVGMHGASAA